VPSVPDDASGRTDARSDRSGEPPLLVYGPRSTTYDFGPAHPLTPRRFGPGISLLETLGAVPNLAPDPATDEELEWIHDTAYIDVVKAFSRNPMGPPLAGIGPGDTPAFAGMHEASAAVAGGSLRAMEAILRGDVTHAFHPGGGLHHAMAHRASGFCVYDDPALAIARARRDGLRVMYIDLDVHHGDGVQAIHWSDPGVLTVSIHESGHSLFPGTGFPDELGGPGAEGSKVNIPLDPGTGEIGWVEALEIALPPLAEAFRPEIVVSQHGADSHAFDPIAHLLVTTTAMGRAARLVDSLAHLHAGGRWLATGGGGYDVYRVVPRMWAHVWLAQSHLAALGEVSSAWRERWAADAETYGQSPIPTAFDDEPNAGLPYRDAQQHADRRAADIARASVDMALTALRSRGGA
jgi:acetoin utilization protein AcuC